LPIFFDFRGRNYFDDYLFWVTVFKQGPNVFCLVNFEHSNSLLATRL
jgi:hypothetical protein